MEDISLTLLHLGLINLMKEIPGNNIKKLYFSAIFIWLWTLGHSSPTPYWIILRMMDYGLWGSGLQLALLLWHWFCFFVAHEGIDTLSLMETLFLDFAKFLWLLQENGRPRCYKMINFTRLMNSQPMKGEKCSTPKDSGMLIILFLPLSQINWVY